MIRAGEVDWRPVEVVGAPYGTTLYVAACPACGDRAAARMSNTRLAKAKTDEATRLVILRALLRHPCFAARIRELWGRPPGDLKSVEACAGA